MTDKRRQTKAAKEIEETKILLDYLFHHELSLDVLEHFSDRTVRLAKEWSDGRDSDF